jgi:SAM-dependent methyltransferase
MPSDSSLLHRSWPALRTSLAGHGFAEFLLRLGLLGLEQTRRRMSLRHLPASACGLEIGALHFPLTLPPAAQAYYIDKHTPEKLSKLCAEVAESIVKTDIIADGFKLGCIVEASQDFLIANHVLEHTTDALGVLLNWLRVLRPGGILFISVPRGERCFDKGRIVTSVDHFLDDYRLTNAGEYAAMRVRNRIHVEEHLNTSAPAIARMQKALWVPPDRHERERIVERLLDCDPEQIHHHVFSQPSYRRLLELLVEVSGGTCMIERVARSSIEIIGIVRKLA